MEPDKNSIDPNNPSTNWRHREINTCLEL